jgi:predicted TIM-barrel fold metal-dependent hydrolase
MIESMPEMLADVPPIISVDDHVVEPPDLFVRWLPAKHREAAPHIEQMPWEFSPEGRHWPFRPAADGPITDFWAYEDLRVVICGATACAGVPIPERSRDPVRFAEMRPGYYSVPERLADMDINNVERSLCFPTFPRFCGQTFLEAHDKDLAAACVDAYNDWMVDEWCGPSGGRLIPLCLIQLWDPQAAAAEIRRNAARGVRAVSFSEMPSNLGLPSIHDANRYWDPVFQACDETGTVICMHIGSSSGFNTTSADAPASVMIALTNMNSQMSMADWLLSGVLARFPQLKIAFSESQIGWMPFMFERVDNIFNKGSGTAMLDPVITKPPSEYVPGRVYGCFFEDDFGIKARDSIGIDQITFETDYPHQDTTWPDTMAYARRAFAGLTEEEIYKVARGNAITMLDLPVRIPGQMNVPLPETVGAPR